VNSDQQFWWNWWVSLGVAGGTLLTVAVALFGDLIRRRFFPPILRMQLLRKAGELTKFTSGEPVRYYHLRVVNERRWSPASDVQVFLTRVEEPGPNGELQVTWLGEVPLRWRHQEVVPLTRSIGPSADTDLCSVAPNDGLRLMPLIVPNSLEARRQRTCKLVTSLQARSIEGDSEVVRVEIAWDGAWEAGEAEMQRHLVVRQLLAERSD